MIFTPSLFHRDHQLEGQDWNQERGSKTVDVIHKMPLARPIKDEWEGRGCLCRTDG